jgi:hypothetical protein
MSRSPGTTAWFLFQVMTTGDCTVISCNDWGRDIPPPYSVTAVPRGESPDRAGFGAGAVDVRQRIGHAQVIGGKRRIAAGP